MSINTEELSTFSDLSVLSKISNKKNVTIINCDKKDNLLNDKNNNNDNCVDSCISTKSSSHNPGTISTKSSSHNPGTKSSSSSHHSDSTTNSSICSSIFDKKICNKIHIDVAVVCEEYNNIEIMCEDHILNLDEIEVTMEIFQLMFYPYKENFGINKDFFINNTKFLPFISFFPEFRTIDGKKFYLLESLISNIESDLCISRYCFTKDSLVELTNEIISLKTLLDIKCCSVLSSLTWSNILDIIKNYKLIHEEVVPVLIVNIVFKTPTQGVKDTVVRFQYKICNNN
jgi:hypothetical protein